MLGGPTGAMLVLIMLGPAVWGQAGQHCKIFDSSSKLIDVSGASTHRKVKLLNNLLACLATQKSLNKDGFYFQVRASETDARKLKRTGLMLAAEAGLSNIAEEFLHLHPKLSIKDFYGNTASIIAARNGNSDLLEVLLGLGADKNYQTGNGNTALIWAVRYDHVNIVITLLDRHADPNIVDNHGQTALYIAALEGLSSITNVLLQNGANPNIQRTSGWSPLMTASNRGHSKGTWNRNMGQTPTWQIKKDGQR